MTTLTRPRHIYVLDAYERQLVLRAIAYRLAHADVPAMCVDDMGAIPTAQTLGVAQMAALDGKLDRRSNIVATRSLYLYADYGGVPDGPYRRDLLALAERLFAQRVDIEAALSAARHRDSDA